MSTHPYEEQSVATAFQKALPTSASISATWKIIKLGKQLRGSDRLERRASRRSLDDGLIEGLSETGKERRAKPPVLDDRPTYCRTSLNEGGMTARDTSAAVHRPRRWRNMWVNFSRSLFPTEAFGNGKGTAISTHGDKSTERESGHENFFSTSLGIELVSTSCIKSQLLNSLRKRMCVIVFHKGWQKWPSLLFRPIHQQRFTGRQMSVVPDGQQNSAREKK